MDDFARQVEALRPQLLRFARTQLRNEALAEDAVSETLLAALEKPQSYGGQSQLKTWLVGILKHKVVDQLRRQSREVASSAMGDGDDEADGLEDLLFRADGHFREMPQDWGDPEAAFGQREFFVVLEACVAQMPGLLGRVFLMREWLELDTAEICKELGITPTNLWVMLHRARLRLRECLQARWFHAPCRLSMPRIFPFDHSCKQVTRLVLLREERPLGWRERLAVRAHMSICDACPRFERQVAFMRAAMARWRHDGSSDRDGE